MADEPVVYIVDDDPAALRSVSALVESIGMNAESYISAEEFLRSFEVTRPGCLVTDVRMLGMSGLELQEKLVSDGVTLPVIVITAYADVPLAVRAMEKGAVTLLEKPCGEQQLLDSIRLAIASDTQARQQTIRHQEIREHLAELTASERDVLKLLVEGKMNKNIATQLDIGLRTVELRRQQIMKKMNVDSLAELVRLVVDADG